MKQFGCVSTPEGTIVGIVVNSFTSAESTEVAEARNEKGKVTDLKSYSVSESVNVRGLLDISEDQDFKIKAGYVFSLNGKDYLIESVNRTENNNTYVEVDFNAKRADDAAIEPIAE